MGQARETSIPLEKVEEAFPQLPFIGRRMDICGFPGNYDPTVNHIQGFSIYEGEDSPYSIVSHSVLQARFAHLLVGRLGAKEQWGFKAAPGGWRHPGGIQIMGDYLFVSNEKEEEAEVYLYDLRPLQIGEIRKVEAFHLHVPHKAGALGDTSYVERDGSRVFLLLLAHLEGENSVYHLYRAEAQQGLERASFQEIASFPLIKDYQGLGLVTEKNTHRVFLVGLYSPREGLHFQDEADLYEIFPQERRISSLLAQRALKTGEGNSSMLGVHFRYGAGVWVTAEGRLALGATERNTLLGDKVQSAIWGG